MPMSRRSQYGVGVNKTKEQEQYARPPPSHRHAAPSAPWPWINLHDEVDSHQLDTPLPPIPPPCNHTQCNGKCWKEYPQSRFPNWTPSQVRRSRIYTVVHDYRKEISCKIHHVDVNAEGLFTDAGTHTVTEDGKDEFWEMMKSQERPPDIRVRALFVENMTGPVLQMLGAKYNIEPFFFSSSLSWIPCRFQEEVEPGKGDHITITLTFLRTMESMQPNASSTNYSSSHDTIGELEENERPIRRINTQAPLLLDHGDGCYLVLDLLAVHLIRNTDGNTIISYHHTDPHATSAPYLHERIRFAGQSVYWQSIFQKSPDPTFVLLTFIWHAMYAWDEALETLYNHICWMETQVISTSNMSITQELHVIRAHHLHYSSLLEDFRKAVVFVRDTPNPAMDTLPEEEKIFSQKLLEKECHHLLIEVDRLEKERMMQEKRLKNVMNLVFSSVNIIDSRRMQDLTEAAVRDSADANYLFDLPVFPSVILFTAMKQIAYLSMIFLPASFVAAVFGMNVIEINPGSAGTLPHYFAAAFPLTAVTIWIVIGFQSKYLFKGRATTFWMRLAWPVVLFNSIWRNEKKERDIDLDSRNTPMSFEEWSRKQRWGQAASA